MATVPKASPPLNLASVTKARLGPSTRVVSQGQSSVEELQSSVNVSFDSAAYGFREEDRSSFDHQRGNRQPHYQPGVVNAPTQAFAAMLEGTETASAGGDSKGPRFSGLRFMKKTPGWSPAKTTCWGLPSAWFCRAGVPGIQPGTQIRGRLGASFFIFA